MSDKLAIVKKKTTVKDLQLQMSEQKEIFAQTLTALQRDVSELTASYKILRDGNAQDMSKIGHAIQAVRSEIRRPLREEIATQLSPLLNGVNSPVRSLEIRVQEAMKKLKEETDMLREMLRMIPDAESLRRNADEMRNFFALQKFVTVMDEDKTK